MVPIHQARSRQFYLEGFASNAKVHAAGPRTPIATLSMSPSKMILLYQAQTARWRQTCILLLALIGLFALHRDPSHFWEHVRLISVCVSTLKKLLRGHSLLLHQSNFLRSSCYR